MFGNVNKRLLPMKAHYFLFNAGTAPVVPFMSVYAKQLGFTSVAVGTIYTILPLVGTVAKPLTGAFADRYKCQKAVFLAAQLLAAVAYLTVTVLPHASAGTMRFRCHESESALSACTTEYDACVSSKLNVGDANVTCRVRCPFTADDWYATGENASRRRGDFYQFAASVHASRMGDCVYLLLGGDERPLCPNGTLDLECEVTCDSYVVNELTAAAASRRTGFWLLLAVYLAAWLLEDKPNRYGYQRMFGSLGWGIFSIAAGYAVDAVSRGQTVKNYTPVFAAAVCILLACVLVSSRIQYQQPFLSTSIARDVCRLVTDLRVFFFMCWCLAVGMCTALMWNFLFWHLEDLADVQSDGCATRDRIKTIEGLVMLVHCVAGELPFFFLSNRILKRLGHAHAMTLVLLTIGVRFVFYSLMTDPWQSLPIELLNGVTFGLFYATMTSYASIVAPPGVETTTQGLVGAVFEGAGVSLGSLVGGLLFQAYGGAKTFLLYGVAALVLAVLHALAQYLVRGSHDDKVKYSTPQDAVRIINGNVAS